MIINSIIKSKINIDRLASVHIKPFSALVES